MSSQSLLLSVHSVTLQRLFFCACVLFSLCIDVCVCACASEFLFLSLCSPLILCVCLRREAAPWFHRIPHSKDKMSFLSRTGWGCIIMSACPPPTIKNMCVPGRALNQCVFVCVGMSYEPESQLTFHCFLSLNFLLEKALSIKLYLRFCNILPIGYFLRYFLGIFAFILIVDCREEKINEGIKT